MSPTSDPPEHPAHLLRAQIQDRMFRKDDPSKCFITHEQVQKFWPRNNDELRTALGLREEWSEHALNLLQRHIKRITCILAWICVGDFSQCLKRLLRLESKADDQSTPMINDTRLPLSVSDCTEAFGDAIGQNFFMNQFIFDAIPISSGSQYVQKEPAERRWPFLHDPETIGAGGYGQVAKVKVVKRYLREGTMSLDQDTYVAVKRFREEEDWFKEVKSLELLKGSLANHDHLVLHLAAIVKGPELSIFLPYTPYGDLETYLGEGYLQYDSAPDLKLYDFSESFPQAHLQEMLREFGLVMNAMDFLHKRVSLKGGQRVFCAHVDLRPQNILVFPPGPDHPAGFWKISDFGISSFKLEDGKSVPDPARGEHPAIGDIIQKIRSRSGSKTTTRPVLMGSHRAPEVSLLHYSHGPRASDIWALACILVELIIFGTGLEDDPRDRQRRLHNFRMQRASYLADEDSTDDNFYDRKSDETPNGLRMTFFVRRKVNEWLDRVANESQCHGIVAIARKMLHPDPRNRLDARESSQQILKYCENGPTSDTRDSESKAKLMWSVYVREQGGRYEYIESCSERETSNEPKLDPIKNKDTTKDIITMDVNTPDSRWPGSLRVTKARVYEDPAYASDIVRSAPSGSLAAYLAQSKSETSSYEVKYRTASDMHSKTDKLSAPSNRTVSLPKEAEWAHISMGESHAVVRGTSSGKSHQTVVGGVDLRSGTYEDLPLGQDHIETLTHVSASGNIIAVGSDEMVWLWGADGATSECPGPEQRRTLVYIAMSNDTQYLFCWWDNSTTNFLQMWRISDRDHPKLAATATFKNVGGRPDKRFIVPCGDLPACIMYDDRGIVATVVVSDEDSEPCQAVPQPNFAKLAFPRSAALCATSNHLLAYVNLHGKIYVHRLVLRPNGTLTVESDPLMIEKSINIKNVQCIGLEQRGQTPKECGLKIYNGSGDALILTLEATEPTESPQGEPNNVERAKTEDTEPDSALEAGHT